MNDADAEYDVPHGTRPEECPYCGRPFPEEELLALHRGLEHGERLTDAERAAYDDAIEAEVERLRVFRLQALAVLLLVYFAFLFAYAVVA